MSSYLWPAIFHPRKCYKNCHFMLSWTPKIASIDSVQQRCWCCRWNLSIYLAALVSRTLRCLETPVILLKCKCYPKRLVMSFFIGMPREMQWGCLSSTRFVPVIIGTFEGINLSQRKFSHVVTHSFGINFNNKLLEHLFLGTYWTNILVVWNPGLFWHCRCWWCI